MVRARAGPRPPREGRGGGAGRSALLLLALLCAGDAVRAVRRRQIEPAGVAGPSTRLNVRAEVFARLLAGSKLTDEEINAYSKGQPLGEKPDDLALPEDAAPLAPNNVSSKEDETHPWGGMSVTFEDLKQKMWSLSFVDTDFIQTYDNQVDAFRCANPFDFVSGWPCRSILVREGFLKLLGSNFRDVVDVNRNSSSAQLPSEQLRLISGSTNKWVEHEYSSLVCKKFSQPCDVRVYGREAFQSLLGLDGGGRLRSDLIRSLRSGPLEAMKPGAGKSGAGFGRTRDGKYLVKLDIRDYEVDGLSELMYGGIESQLPLGTHLQNNPGSVLNRYYGLIKVRVFGYDRYALLMADATYGYGSKVKNKDAAWRGIYDFATYDLKDREGREAAANSATLENSEFKHNEGNELHLAVEQCNQLSETVSSDALYLASHNLVDFSLLLTVTKKRERGPGPVDFPRCEKDPEPPSCLEHDLYKYTLSIIDYLTPYNAWKQAESSMPWWWGKFTNYGAKLDNFAKKICRLSGSE